MWVRVYAADDSHATAAKDAAIQRLSSDMARLRRDAERAADEAALQAAQAHATIAQLTAQVTELSAGDDERARCVGTKHGGRRGGQSMH